MRRVFLPGRRRKRDTPLIKLTQPELDPYLRPGGGISERNLSGLSLVEKDLRGADFSRCDLADADLRGAKLQGANLTDCKFARAELHGARLEGALLRGADLTRAYGLTQDQLRATRLPGAKLPAALFTFDGLDRVRDLVNRGERTLYVLLLACASVIVICLTSSDEQLFHPGTALTLPSLNLPVPLTGFYQLAPLLLLGFYLSLSFTLRKLWIELSNLPAQFHNDRWLYRQAASSTPSFVSVLAPHLRVEPQQPRMWGELILMMVTVWWVTPAVLLLVVADYLPRHDPLVTRWHAWVLAVTMLAGILFQFSMVRILGRSFRELRAQAPDEERDPADGSSSNDREGSAPTPSKARKQASPASRRRVPSSGHERSRQGVLRESLLALSLVVTGAALWGLWQFTQTEMDRAGCLDLLERATEEPGTCNRNAAKLGGASLEGVQLARGNLRRAFMHSARLRNSNLEDARLEFANLISADMRGANLKDAELRDAVLWEANLDSARLKEAVATGADLRGASLRDAEVQGADFTGANLEGVDWAEAIVCGARFTPGRVNPTDLLYARGWDRAFGTGIDSLSGTQGNDRPPPYLRDHELLEYDRWLRAWRAARSGPPVVRAGGVNYDSLRSYLLSIDLSMAEARQREKEILLREARRLLPRSGTHMVEYHRLKPRVDSLLAEIDEKAANHCVDVNAR